MKLQESQYQDVDIKGYIEVPADVFGDITPFTLRDHEKMGRLMGEYTVVTAKPDWIAKLPEGEDVSCIEWNGYLILEAPSGE